MGFQCAAIPQAMGRRNEVLGWVKEGARDFSISRAAVEWGIPISRDPKQTVYVWFDALNGAKPAFSPLNCSALPVSISLTSESRHVFTLHAFHPLLDITH
eukprot:scaffold116205_cov32-Prasinocladus_malaysianus.AAC.2